MGEKKEATKVHAFPAIKYLYKNLSISFFTAQPFPFFTLCSTAAQQVLSPYFKSTSTTHVPPIPPVVLHLFTFYFLSAIWCWAIFVHFFSCKLANTNVRCFSVQGLCWGNIYFFIYHNNNIGMIMVMSITRWKSTFLLKLLLGSTSTSTPPASSAG